MSSFTLCPATLADCPRLSEITQAAFASDPLFHKMYPTQLTSPGAFSRAVEARQRLRALDPSVLVLAAVCPDTQRIAGFGVWQRVGRTVNPDAGALMAVERVLETWVQRACRVVLGDAMDGRVLEAMGRAMQSDTERYWGAGRERWYLQLLAVDPAFQRRGVGQAIVRYGMKRAETDGVGCYLEASKMGEGMYKGLGWREVGESSDGLGVGIPTKVLVWEPEEVEVKRRVLGVWGK